MKTEVLKTASELIAPEIEQITAANKELYQEFETLAKEIQEYTALIFPLSEEFEFTYDRNIDACRVTHPVTDNGIRNALVTFDFGYFHRSPEFELERAKVRVYLPNFEWKLPEVFYNEMVVPAYIIAEVMTALSNLTMEKIESYFFEIHKMRTETQDRVSVIHQKISELTDQVKSKCVLAFKRTLLIAGASLEGIYSPLYMKDRYYSRNEYKLIPFYSKMKTTKDVTKVEIIFEANPKDFVNNPELAKLYTKKVNVPYDDFYKNIGAAVYALVREQNGCLR